MGDGMWLRAGDKVGINPTHPSLLQALSSVAVDTSRAGMSWLDPAQLVLVPSGGKGSLCPSRACVHESKSP